MGTVKTRTIPAPTRTDADDRMAAATSRASMRWRKAVAATTTMRMKPGR